MRHTLKYAGEVVVILMGAGKTPVGEALAAALGWRVAEHDEPRALHAIVAGVLGRREHVVITTRTLSETEQANVRGDLHGVRFVDLSEQRGSPGEIAGALRGDFGF
jgi:hypothetical protein